MTTADVSNATSVVDLAARLESEGLSACRSLCELAEGSDNLATEIQDKFHPAVRDIERVVIKPLPVSDGAFVVIDGVLYLNEEPISNLLATVVAEFELRAAANDHHLSAMELPRLLESVFIDYMLHELRHRTQGIERYEEVQRLKAITGQMAVSEFDLFADRDAAFGYAAIRSGHKKRSLFLADFREALFFSSAYFFKVFPIAGDRHDKIQRAIGVLLMAARLAPLQLAEAVDERADLPLDAPLHVFLSSNQNSLAIFKGEPSRRLLGTANSAQGVRDLVNDVGTGDFDSALQRSVRIVADLKDFR